MEVFIIEHREFIGDDQAFMDTVVMHVSSSKELAIEWCKNNLDADSADGAWWFAIYRDVIDSLTDVNPSPIFTVDKHGNILVEKLVPDYALSDKEFIDAPGRGAQLRDAYGSLIVGPR